jgi:hypothetical protein
MIRKFVPAALALGFVVTANAQPAAPAEAPTAPATEEEAAAPALDPAKVKVDASYALGFQNGQQLGSYGIVGDDIDDVHVTLAKMAVIEAARPANPDPCFYLTTLVPNAPKIMLNTESGDHGVLETRACGCPFDKVGHHLHIRNLQSYEKLTAGGLHFLADDLIRLVEEVFPQRFGGGPTDYQILEDQTGELPRVFVVVSPRLGAIDEGAVVAAALESLGRRSAADDMMAQQLQQGRVLGVWRRELYSTPAGKVPAFHVLRD